MLYCTEYYLKVLERIKIVIFPYRSTKKATNCTMCCTHNSHETNINRAKKKKRKEKRKINSSNLNMNIYNSNEWPCAVCVWNVFRASAVMNYATASIESHTVAPADSNFKEHFVFCFQFFFSHSQYDAFFYLLPFARSVPFMWRIGWAQTSTMQWHNIKNKSVDLYLYGCRVVRTQNTRKKIEWMLMFSLYWRIGREEREKSEWVHHRNMSNSSISLWTETNWIRMEIVWQCDTLAPFIFFSFFIFLVCDKFNTFFFHWLWWRQITYAPEQYKLCDDSKLCVIFLIRRQYEHEPHVALISFLLWLYTLHIHLWYTFVRTLSSRKWNIDYSKCLDG